MWSILSRVVLGLAVLAMAGRIATAQQVAANWPLPTTTPAIGDDIRAPATATPATAPGTLVAQVPMAPTPVCTPPIDPYKNPACLDAYLGDDIATRMFRYYQLEWGQSGPPADPTAPASRIDGWPRTPATIPPMAYTEWPTGALTSIGVSQPNAVDSPFMVAIANTTFGQWLQDNHQQIYGWINGGFNISSNTTQPAGNGPIGYAYTPNTAQLDQAVIYLERLPDTVQTDHFDWGQRLSVIYGENYRYTNSYGIASYQFNGKNNINGYDFPMEYVDLYWPQPFGHLVEGLEIRIGRYISIPDIEAQLAPNNLTYTHSLTYTWDNYTNEGIVSSWQITPNIMVQLGITDGTETPIWHYNTTTTNLFGPNALYGGTTYKVDPGNQPSATACLQLRWNDGWDTLYPCIDGLNNGQWGYNNIQWHGGTYYHRFNDQWHNDFESYYISEYGVPNLRNATAQNIFANGGTPFSPGNLTFNAPNQAYCGSISEVKCNVHAIGVLDYLNYTPDPLNNYTMRLEWYDDPQGWRTGTGGRTQYFDVGWSWQHWFSPQVTIRPEITFWHAVGAPPFDGSPTKGIAPTRKNTAMFASDLIFHF
jgi:hypothetical protein